MKPIKLSSHRAKRQANAARPTPPAPSRGRILYSLQSYFWQVQEAVDLLPMGCIVRAAEELLRARAEGKTVYVLGNGGSAATAIHAATDWLKPNKQDGVGGVATVSLVDNVGLLTAWANDTCFDNVFAAQLEGRLEPGDVVIAVSGSGNSPNVLRAVEVAAKAGAVTIGLSGFDGGALAGAVDISVVVPCDSQGMIEDVHLVLVHALAATLRQPVEVPARSDAGDEARTRSKAG
jgi:D-sedoheptulose 7-phosphate isomerase